MRRDLRRPARPAFRSGVEGFGRSLAYADFRRLVVGQCGRGYAQWTQVTALPPIALSLHGSASEIGLIWALQFGPILFLAPFGGVIADRYHRSSVLALLHATLALVALTTATVVVARIASMQYLLASALAFGLATAFEMPVRQSLVADLVPPSDLRNAVALHQAAFNVTRVVGPLVTTTVVLLAGPPMAIVCGASASIIAAVALRAAARRHDTVRDLRPRVVGRPRIAEGIVAARASGTIRVVLALVAITAALGMSFQSIIAVYLVQNLRIAPAAHGFVIAAIGVGTLSGSLASAGRPGTERTLWIAAIALCLTVAAFALAPGFVVIIIVATGIGCTYGAVAATANFLVQASVQPQVRGRVLGIYLATLNGALAVGSYGYGIAAGVLGTEPTILAGGAVGAAALASVLAVRRNDRSPRRDAGGTSMGDL